MADPDLELRGGAGPDLLALVAFFPSVIYVIELMTFIPKGARGFGGMLPQKKK